MEIRSRSPRVAVRRPSRVERSAPAAVLAETAIAATPARPPAPRASPRDLARRRELDRALAEITAALLLASTGQARRVVVCDLRQAAIAARALRGVASELGLELTVIARAEGGGTDVSVAPR